ncbi:MAG: AMP-binding protein [Ectothiorhodospiraceae bacterium]|nr:AMP-binding protein [Ectothiorhodospiraceae bacterium]
MLNDEVSAGLTLNRIYANALPRFGDKLAMVCADDRITYRALFESACKVAHALTRQGVGRNVRVALAMSNCIEYAIADQGIIQAGATKVPLNDMLGEKEIKHIIKDSNARVAIVGKNFFEVFKSNRTAWPELETIVGIASPEECPSGFVSWQEFMAENVSGPPEVQVEENDLAMIGYTGGTTGVPKGVLHTQRTIALDMLSHIAELGFLDDERILLSSPLPHAAGFLMLAALLKGATHFVDVRFDTDKVIDRIEKEKVTFTFLVPTMIYRLLDRLKERNADLSSLRTVVYGAAPITVDRLREGLARFGPVFMQIYGQTEVPNLITRLRREEHRVDESVVHRLKSCGQPVTMAEVRIIDGEGAPVPVGESGELAVRAPYAMLGYHGLPEKTAETLVNGWIMTGDIAKQDEDGYIYLLDRSKDMIISGGMNVYTTEVENAIQGCPGVGQVCVIGVPHPDWGEAVSAFIVPEAGATLTEQDVKDHCRGELSAYKRPKMVKFVDDLPLTAYGKLDKKVLRAAAQDELKGSK